MNLKYATDYSIDNRFSLSKMSLLRSLKKFQFHMATDISLLRSYVNGDKHLSL